MPYKPFFFSFCLKSHLKRVLKNCSIRLKCPSEHEIRFLIEGIRRVLWCDTAVQVKCNINNNDLRENF